MQVALSVRFILIADEDSFYLIDRKNGHKVWPEDVIQPFPNWGFRPASEHVRRMARSAMLKPEQRELVERFCQAVPDQRVVEPPDPGPDPNDPTSLGGLDS